MKFSQFNSLVSMDASYALYNAFTQQFPFLEKRLYDLLLSKPSVVELNEHHPSLYEHLVENSFIVTDEIDEVDAVKQLAEKNRSGSFELSTYN